MAQNPHARSHLLVLTACIAPKAGMAGLLNRTSIELRLQDYIEAIQFWLRLREPSIGGILFADNSGYPLDRLQAVVQGETNKKIPVELVSFDHPAPPPTLSYGHNELILINEAIKRSALAKQFPYLMKATGRYRFPDIGRLIRKLPSDYRVALDTTGEKPWPWRQRSVPICRFALTLMKFDFYHQYLADTSTRMRPAPPWDRRQFIESMFYDQLYPMRAEPGIILRWPCNCEPEGIGSNGMDYRSPGRRIRSGIRSLNRKIIPNLWL